jgi:predicted aldo/keto reductase-like oxidoreductase
MTSGILQREVGFLAPQIQQKDLYELALKFVLSDSRIHAGIVGMRWPTEVAQNVKLIEGWTPPIDFATMPRLTFEVYKADDAQ